MEQLLGQRIVVSPRPQQRREPALDVALLGHCPGRVRRERLLSLPGILDDLRSAGLGAQAEALLSGREADGTPLDEALYQCPIPLRASAEFHDIFPDAARAPTRYISLLAGSRAWLPQAVDDFFANGGARLWVMRIDESLGQAGFLPGPASQLHDLQTLQGLARLLVIPSLAVIALPDLERLQIPARLPDVPRVRLDNPDPRFLPCTALPETDDHRERRYSRELDDMPAPAALEQVLRALLPLLGRQRPDVQLLLTLPLAYSGEIDSPVLDPQALARLQQLRDAADGSGHLLRHIQFLFPYLRGPRYALHSPVGLIAGKQAGIAQSHGPWHSIGAQPLLCEGLPYPRLTLASVLALRDQPGIGILRQRSGFSGRSQLSLDDERLMVPALPPADYAGTLFNSMVDDSAANDMTGPGRLSGFRSAEIMRFMGFLRRQLQALGEQLVFNIDPQDPRPRLLLEQFFRRLYQLGALRGSVAEDAFRIRQSLPQEGALQFDIEVAPALPIDRLHLTFANRHGEWAGDIVNG